MSELAHGILILDWGSRDTLSVARRIRELGVYSEVWACNDVRVARFLAGDISACGVVLGSGRGEHEISGAVDVGEFLALVTVPLLDLQMVGLQASDLEVKGGVSVSDAVLADFVRKDCGCAGTWNMADFLERSIAQIRAQVGKEGRVICGLSGGVDSSVVAAILHRAIGDRLTCVLVDHGLLREGEVELVRDVFEDHFGVDLRVVDARERFLEQLEGVEDPEEKRRRIGESFVRVFEQIARDVEGARFLAQGTLYPDVIESVHVLGKAATIKSHHNVGGLPADLNLSLVEPLRELFKDEVRALGRVLGLPAEMVDRHPFPGPGLGVRILGEVTAERLAVVRAADHIFIEALRREGLYHSVWQAFAVLLPVKSVGMVDGKRTYEEVIALRAVMSRDGMRADFSHLPMDFLGNVSSDIILNVRGVSRVVYDVSSKPPATIEWE